MGHPQWDDLHRFVTHRLEVLRQQQEVLRKATKPTTGTGLIIELVRAGGLLLSVGHKSCAQLCVDWVTTA